jgi:hypothetical protein
MKGNPPMAEAKQFDPDRIIVVLELLQKQLDGLFEISSLLSARIAALERFAPAIEKAFAGEIAPPSDMAGQELLFPTVKTDG